MNKALIFKQTPRDSVQTAVHNSGSVNFCERGEQDIKFVRENTVFFHGICKVSCRSPRATQIRGK